MSVAETESWGNPLEEMFSRGMVLFVYIVALLAVYTILLLTVCVWYLIKCGLPRTPHPSNQRPRFLVLEGNICAGKTTASRYAGSAGSWLSRKYRVVPILEEVNTRLLMCYLNNQKALADKFQTVMLTTRRRTTVQTIQACASMDREVLVCADRLLGDGVFWLYGVLNGNMSARARPIYLSLMTQTWADTLERCPTDIVYVHAPFKTCVTRLRARDTADNGVDECLLEDLEIAYFYSFLWLLQIKDVLQCKCYVVDHSEQLQKGRETSQRLDAIFQRLDERTHPEACVMGLLKEPVDDMDEKKARDPQETKRTKVSNESVVLDWDDANNVEMLSKYRMPALRADYRLVHTAAFRHRLLVEFARTGTVQISRGQRQLTTIFDAVKEIFMDGDDVQCV